MKDLNFIETGYIEEITPQMRGYGKYKYRVIGCNGFASHHTNDYSDAEKWLEKCREYWRKNTYTDKGVKDAP